jgi:hypothetical protein
MNEVASVSVTKRRRKLKASPALKPNLPPLDGLAAAQEACRHAQEGNVKLSRTVDYLRQTLQTLAVAEWDRELNAPVSPADLRKMAAEALSAIWPDWRRRQVVTTRAGSADHDLSKNRLNDGEDYD